MKPSSSRSALAAACYLIGTLVVTGAVLWGFAKIGLELGPSDTESRYTLSEFAADIAVVGAVAALGLLFIVWGRRAGGHNGSARGSRTADQGKGTRAVSRDARPLSVFGLTREGLAIGCRVLAVAAFLLAALSTWEASRRLMDSHADASTEITFFVERLLAVSPAVIVGGLLLLGARRLTGENHDHDGSSAS